MQTPQPCSIPYQKLLQTSQYHLARIKNKMDYFKELTSDTSIHEYLKDFPENDWKLVVKKTLLYGIHSLKALENLGLASPKLEKIPALHSEITELKKTTTQAEFSQTHQVIDLHEKQKRADITKDQSKTQIKPRGTSQKQIRDRAKASQVAVLRGSSKEVIKQPPLKFTGKEKPEVRRKLPKYLQNIDSKIRDDVMKSKKGVNFYAVKGERSERSDRDKDKEKEKEKDRELKVDKSLRNGEGKSERYDRYDRFERIERAERNDKNDRSDKKEINERSEKVERKERIDKEDRYERKDKEDRYEKNLKAEKHDTQLKNDKREKNCKEDWPIHDKTDKVEQGRWDEWKNVDLSRRKSEKGSDDSRRSSSSFSTYHAADEVKEFYQKEFSKLMPFGGNQKW